MTLNSVDVLFDSAARCSAYLLKPMNHSTLNNDDIKTCIELACDGVNIHLQDQSKLDVIHKIMYAVAEAAQSDETLHQHLESDQVTQYTIRINARV